MAGGGGWAEQRQADARWSAAGWSALHPYPQHLASLLPPTLCRQFSNLPRFPAVIGQFVHTFNLFPGLPLADRASIIPWLYTALDLNATPGSYER